MSTLMVQKLTFSHKEIIEAYQFSNDIIKMLFSDGNVGFYANDISSNYYCIALQYAEMNDVECTLNSLDESCRYAIIESNLNDVNYTAPMVNRKKCIKTDIHKNYKGNACNLRLKALGDKRFDFVRNEERFKKIISDLEKYAEQS